MRLGMSVLAVLLSANVAFAQAAADMATLERRVEDARAAYSRSQTSADESELREIEEDLTYLRVKTRRGEQVTARERRNLSDRIDRFLVRMNANNTSTGNNTGTYERAPRANRTIRGAQIPSGSEVDAR